MDAGFPHILLGQAAVIDATPIKKSTSGFLARPWLGLLALIASVPAFAVDAQAGATTFWSQYFRTCGSSIVWTEGKQTYEGRGWQINVEPTALTLADKLNGYQWSGETSMDVQAYRVRDANSSWTAWYDGKLNIPHRYVAQLYQQEGTWKSSGPLGVTVSPGDCRVLQEVATTAKDDPNARSGRQEQSQDQQRYIWATQLVVALQRAWIRPPGVNENLKVKVSIRMDDTGEVLATDIKDSSGNPVYDRSVLGAIYRASPLPLPRDPSIFQQQIVVTFSPRT